MSFFVFGQFCYCYLVADRTTFEFHAIIIIFIISSRTYCHIYSKG